MNTENSDVVEFVVDLHVEIVINRSDRGMDSFPLLSDLFIKDFHQFLEIKHLLVSFENANNP